MVNPQDPVGAGVLLSEMKWTVAPLVDSAFGISQEGIPATVPGDVHDDLERAGLMLPNNIGMGDPRWIDVGAVGWRYRTSFKLPSFKVDQQVWLDFDGVDFSCQVFVDGVAVGINSGMYRRFVVDITHVARPGAQVVLEIEIDPMPEGIGAALRAADGAMSDEGGPDFFVFVNNRIRRALKDLKSPTVASYDWGVDTWTVGIWRDVRLRVTGASRIDDLRIDVAYGEGVANLALHVTLADETQHDSIVRFEVRDEHGEVVAKGESTRISRGSRAGDGHLTIVEPALWWPVGYGKQPLYTVSAAVSAVNDPAPEDVTSRRIGIRRVEWTQVEGADVDFINPFRLLVNGVAIRTMGSSLLPPDLLYGRINRRGTWLLHAAVAAGFNTLRLWGGGVLLPDSMYDLADELGILLLQEMFLANSLPEVDPEFLGNLEVTVRNVVRRIRHHPSIIEWGGGNEMFWKQADDHPALRVMRAVIASEDDRIFRATCPMEGSRHSPWHFDPATSYAHYDDLTMTDNLEGAPLMRYGEFGAPSPAHLEVWERDIPAESRWPIDRYDDPVLVRKNVFSAAFGEEFWLMPSIIEEFFGLSRSLRDLIRAGQFLGGEGVRYAIDALRRRGRWLGGFTTWDFNEPWPNGAGSYLIDYDGRPLAAHARAREAMAPISVSLRLEGILHPAGSKLNIPVVLTSDAPALSADLRWTAIVYGLDGAVLHETGAIVAAIAPLDSIAAGSIDLEMPPDGSPLLVHLSLEGPSGRITERVQILGARDVVAPLAALLPDDRHPAAHEIAEAGVDPANMLNLAAMANGGRIVAISGAEARNDNPTIALIDGAYAVAPDRYSGVGAWRSTTELGWIQVKLARAARVSRICLGRDRSGSEHDRTLDELRIEVSEDGERWTEVAKFDRLAAVLGDRVAGMAPSLHASYPPTWTLDVRLPATDARYVRFEVRGRRGARKFVALDEIEVYEDPAVVVGEPGFIVRDHREGVHRLGRTTLAAEVIGAGISSAGLETMTIRLRNTGDVLALFCDISSVDGYWPRMLVDSATLSIPPREHRDVTVSADPGLSAPIGTNMWQVTAWNADATRIGRR